MREVLARSNYNQVLEIVYFISKNMLFGYPVESLRSLIDASLSRQEVYDSIRAIELAEQRTVDELPPETKQRYLVHLHRIVLERTGELVEIDSAKANALIGKIRNTLSLR